MNRWIKKIFREAQKNGLQVVEYRTKNHLKVVLRKPPNTEVVSIVAPVTPSDYRVFMNVRADIRRAAKRLSQ